LFHIINEKITEMAMKFSSSSKIMTVLK